MSEDAKEQHQEQPSVSERSPDLAEGCCTIAVAAPERVRGRPFPPGVSGNPAGPMGIGPRPGRDDKPPLAIRER
jgi:hypothetical protein